LKQLGSLIPPLVSDQILCVFDPGSLFHALDFLRLAT
jgi:hypothetical protein